MKYLMLFLLSLNFLYSAEITKVKTYKEAIELANEKNKKAMVMLTTAVCPWCHKMKTATLKDDAVVKYVSEHFIFVEVDRDEDKGEYPEDLYSRMVPSFSIVNPSDEELLYQVIGYKTPAKFLKEINLNSTEDDNL